MVSYYLLSSGGSISAGAEQTSVRPPQCLGELNTKKKSLEKYLLLQKALGVSLISVDPHCERGTRILPLTGLKLNGQDAWPQQTPGLLP